MAKKIALGKGIASLLQDTSTPQSVVLNSYANQNFVSSSESSESDDHYHDEVDHGEEQTLKNSEGIVKIEHTPLLIAIEKIKPNSDQPRKIFKEKELDELAESIKENGIIQPLIVVELEKGEFELIAGERRLRAAKKAGLEMVPAVVKRATDREKAIF